MSFEHLPDGLGIGVPTPRLTWTLPAGGGSQEAYELEVARDGRIDRTGRVAERDQVLVAWPGDPLNSRERATVRVRVWTTEASEPSHWSTPSAVEAGLLDAADWQAAPVGAAWPEDPGAARPARVRKDFRIDRTVARARLYITAHGLYEAEINGRRVGDETLAPGWTVYPHRLRYRTHDVTSHLTQGANTIGAWLGDGWYRGKYGFDGGTRNIYGTDQSLIAQLEVTYDDGTTVTIATDRTWNAAPGPILTSGLYEGETFDARLHDPDWATPSGATVGQWTPVRTGSRDMGTLVAPQGPPVRCTQEITPVAITRTGDDSHLLDFGQNLVGRLRVTLDGPAGTAVTLRHAEVLEQGELATRPLREAYAEDTLILSGRGPLTWEPRFTLHGFRYAEVSGWTADLTADTVTARVHHTDMRRTGWFECSDPLVNRLHENVVWSMRGNFVDIPTDCPQRDERLGWTGDIQVFAPTASYLYDCSGMLDSWLTDVGLEQLPDGTIPWYVPVIPGEPMWTPIHPGAAWGDVATLTPWTLYQRFGDLDLLSRHYPMAKAWVDLVDSLAGPTRLWDTGFQLGDWLDPTAPPDDPAGGRTDRYLVATAYFAHSARHLALTAAALGNAKDAHHYSALADEVADAFRRRYLLPSGHMTSDSPTAYAVALSFDLLTPPQRQPGDRLAQLVLDDGARIATGFVGTPLICDALTDTGHLDIAYRLLLQTQCPSWLYTVAMGATTIWERWDSLRPDGTLNPGGMTSFNHYALGAVADWLHRVVGGITASAPGYRKIVFRPRPGGSITWARTRHETPYGTASLSWEETPDGLTAHIALPEGCEAIAELPGCTPIALRPGEHFLNTAELAPEGHLNPPRPVSSSRPTHP
ncbi:family 78 glycoside hydrolase catalytic domain [Streptomyces laculatispora]|uniref:alpha-L-rhamnosidase n=1 Tax=Streptomyces laculatispora TaxID=887464 RepID=A0ABY9HZF1_9ACTN|nr:alpha-L-rhamnosidase [Streptomyces laculatispora]WLQ39967.1 family 78 glycoside hydrolase catalytic domain [Streptomyces laculatispora]